MAVQLKGELNLLPVRSSTLSQTWVTVFVNVKLVESPACKLLNQHNRSLLLGCSITDKTSFRRCSRGCSGDHITGVDNKRLTGCILPWSHDSDLWLDQSIGPQ